MRPKNKSMKRLTLLTLILTALVSITADAQTKDAAPVSGDDIAANEIRGWLDRWTKAVIKQDVDAIMALYTDDVVAYDLVPPLAYVGKSAIAAITSNSSLSTKVICMWKSAISMWAPPVSLVMLLG
jgi:hypothetical protein